MTKTPNTSPMKPRKNALVAFGALVLLPGCGGMSDTNDQEITLETAPMVSSTACTLSNSNGAWSVWNTPTIAQVLKDSKPLYVTCHSPLGWSGHIAVSSHGSILSTFTAEGDSRIAEMSDAPDPKTMYQGNLTNKANGLFRAYPGTIIVPMKRDEDY